MAESLNSPVVETAATDTIHDIKCNFTGKKVATGSEHGLVRVYDVNEMNSSQKLIAELHGHEGPVWEVDWAPLQFGDILASCSYDQKVIIWKKEVETGDVPTSTLEYFAEFMYNGHTSSVNSVCWAPPDWGLMLACGSADGSFSIMTYEDVGWAVEKFEDAHALGCNSVSWSPAPLPTFEESSSIDHPKRFVTGGCDNLVKVWSEQDGNWIESSRLEGHSDWVTHVAWSPSVVDGLSKIASASQNGRVIIWTSRENDIDDWTLETLEVFADTVDKLSWNITGEVLAVSSGDNEPLLWMKLETGVWECISNPSTSNMNTPM